MVFQAGALLACGIVNSGVRNECDPAMALLSDYVMHNSNTMRVGAIIGLGFSQIFPVDGPANKNGSTNYFLHTSYNTFQTVELCLKWTFLQIIVLNDMR